MNHEKNRSIYSVNPDTDTVFCRHLLRGSHSAGHEKSMVIWRDSHAQFRRFFPDLWKRNDQEFYREKNLLEIGKARMDHLRRNVQTQKEKTRK